MGSSEGGGDSTRKREDAENKREELEENGGKTLLIQ